MLIIVIDLLFPRAIPGMIRERRRLTPMSH